MTYHPHPPHMPGEMPCPHCERPIPGGTKVKAGNEWPACPHCGKAVKKVVPLFSPETGGPSRWHWEIP